MKILFITLMLMFSTAVFADCDDGNEHHYCDDLIPGIQGEQGEQGEQGIAGIDSGWTDSEITEMFAASSAMSGLDFDSTTNKLQLGLALGGYGSQTDLAVGVAKNWDSDKTGDVLFSFKTTLQESGDDGKRPWVVGAVWKVNLQ